jgi:hypothetical protein
VAKRLPANDGQHLPDRRAADLYTACFRNSGRVDELHRTVLRLGRKRFGQPDEETRQAICGIQDPERPEVLSEPLLDVSTWDELLA